MTRPLSLTQARFQYPNRYTLEHVPEWAKRPHTNGKFYAPQYRTDAEWFEKAIFPGEGELSPRAKHCCSSGQTWPLGKWLDAPYRRGVAL